MMSKKQGGSPVLTRSFRQLLSAALLLCLTAGVVPAQTRRAPAKTQTAAAAPPRKAAACTGAWTGVVTYARTRSQTNNKTVPRVSGRGEDTTDWEMRYDYRATVSVVESPERNGSSAGRANVNHSFTSNETVTGRERNSCDRGKTWQVMTGTSTSKTETSGNASGLEANVNVGVNTDGTYTVSVGVPQIKGRTTGQQTSTFSGQCTPKEVFNHEMATTETTIDGNSLTSDGTHRIDPN